jgi:hypothetical protein
MRTVVTSLAVAALAVSTASANTNAAAEAAFQRATKLRTEGKWAEACDAFKQSNDLDPQFGTAFNLAGCYLQIKKLVAAWSVYSELSQKDTNAGRKAKSAELVAQLQPRLSWIKIEPPASRPPGFDVTLDGESAVRLLGIEAPYDIGPHKLVATATGMESFSKDVVIESEGQHLTVTIPPLSVPTTKVEPPKQVAVVETPDDQVVARHDVEVRSPWILIANATAGVYSAPPGENAPAFAAGIGGAVGRRVAGSLGVIAALNGDVVVDQTTFQRIFVGAGVRFERGKIGVNVTPGLSILTGASETVLGFGGDAIVTFAITTKLGVALHVNASSVGQPEGFMGNLTVLRAGLGVSFQP